MVAILNLLWVPVVAFVGIAIPDKILTIPILAAFAVSLAAFRHALPAARRDPEEADRSAPCLPPCRCSGRWRARSAVGLIKDHLPFVRTAKGGRSPQAAATSRLLGSVLGALLMIGAIALIATNHDGVREIYHLRGACWWCRACRSCRPPRSPRSRARASTTSRSGSELRGSRRCVAAAAAARAPRSPKAAAPSSSRDGAVALDRESRRQ